MANEPRSGGGSVGEDLRQQRHESRAGSTYKGFLKDVCSLGGFDEQFAERAAVAVLGTLERRLFAEEARDLEAQLPSKLRELLQATRHEGKPGEKFKKEQFLEMIGRDLGKNRDEAEGIVRAVFAAVRAQISEGEAGDVADQLPHDLAALWRLPA